LIAKACARFGAIEEEIADELHINHATLDNWKKKYPEFLGALKAGKDAIDDRVEDSLYRLAIGWNGAAPNVTACIFWLKNRRPSEWRDVQNIEASHAHYIVADRPMTEEEWIAARADRAKTIEDQPQGSPNTSVVRTLPEPDTQDEQT
jgi:hypothetical protein